MSRLPSTPSPPSMKVDAQMTYACDVTINNDVELLWTFLQWVMFELFNQVCFRKLNNSQVADSCFICIRHCPASHSFPLFICFISLPPFLFISSLISISHLWFSFYSSLSSYADSVVSKSNLYPVILSSFFIVISPCFLYSSLSLPLLFLLDILLPPSSRPPSSRPWFSTLNKPSIIKQIRQVPIPFDFPFAGRRPRPPSCNLLPFRGALLQVIAWL